ncbi:MAG: glycosyltransferase family 4 protein [Candidatus Aenigmarchaeota archaeon]|nr:glycosyltransferase family 4 protein [Candidatus Aenigmarchaeota archaeon]
MKIAFVTPAYYPALMGAALYSKELAENLAKKGHEVKIFTPLMHGLKEKEEIDGIEITRPKKTQITESYYVSAEMIKAVAREKFDVIHSHHYGYFPATAGLIAAKLRKTPHVFGPYYHPPVYGRKRWLMFSAYHITQGLPLLRFSGRVLPHTEYEKRMLMRIGGREDNMDILPNIVDTRRFRPKKTNKKREKTVLFVSNLLFEKGAHTAMDIAGQLLKERDDVKFVFIGNPYQHALLPKIEQLSRNRNVKFLKNLPLGRLIEWYQRSLVMMLPSKYEAFSRVIAEAESCGCAIVATNVGGIPEVVRNGKSGFLVDYGKWDEMKEKIDYLLDNSKEAEKMGREGSAHVKENFDTKIVVKKLHKIYEEIA